MKYASLIVCIAILTSCNDDKDRDERGLKAAHVKVQTGSDGLTVEQRNVKRRILEDAKPGSVKHLYVISAYSGQVIIYSTVKGKVTSSGKRLTPLTTIGRSGATNIGKDYFLVDIGGREKRTSEVMQDDGSYGTSISYLYWWDVQGRYHQHYISGGQILHVSDYPLPVKSITINLAKAEEP